MKTHDSLTAAELMGICHPLGLGAGNDRMSSGTFGLPVLLPSLSQVWHVTA